MAQQEIAQAYAGASASKMERDLVLWARDGGELKTRFEETERREHEAYLAAQEVIRAKFEHKRRSLSAKLSLEETQELSDITDSAAKAELSNLQQDYEAARERRSRAHAEDIKFHHEKVHALMALSQPTYAPAVNPFASPVQHNNAAYQSNAANSAYSAYSSAPAAAAQAPNGTVGADGSRYESNAQYPARQSPQTAPSAAPQSYNAAAYPYQQQQQQSSAYHRGPAEENRAAPSPYQQPMNAAMDNQHHHSPAKAQSFQAHAEQRRVSDQPAPLAPAQPKIPSHYVLPSQRDPSELVGRHGAQEQRYGPTSNLMPGPQPVAEAEERGAAERKAIEPSRRSSAVSDGLAGAQDTPASRTKRKADEAVPSPDGTISKRTRGMDVTFDADRLRRPRTAGRDAPGAQGVTQSPQSQSARKPSAGESRTTTFDEVYQDGNPRYKHLIVEFPASSNRFYILRCDDHGVHFNASNPLAGAAKHLASTQHGNMTKEHANAIERLGWRIVDCTPEKANLNNEMVKLAFQAGYKAFNRNFLTKKDRKSLEGNGTTEGAPAPHSQTPSGRRMSSRKQEASVRKQQPVPIPIAKRTPEPVTDPAPGELYRAFWSEEKRNYAVVILPWGDLSRVGFNGTLATTGLLDRAPKCYVIDRMVPKILGWSAGFEDGGSLVDKREFPVCYFDNRSSVGWVRARDLQPFDYDDPSSVPNFDEAVRYLSKVKEFSQAEQRLGQPDVGVSAPRGSSLPEKKDSTSAATTAAATPQPQEDEVMADAPPVSDDDSESFHASEFSAATDDVEMEGAESRRTSISNKAAPQSNEQELAENSISSRSPPTEASAQAPIPAGNEKTGKSDHEITKQAEVAAPPPSVQLRSEESAEANNKADTQPEAKADTKPKTELEHKLPPARPATASAPPPDRAADVESAAAARPKSASGLSTAPASQALPQAPAQAATDQAPHPTTSGPPTGADPSPLATKPVKEQPHATGTEGKPTTIFAAGLGPLLPGASAAASESPADKWRAIRAPSTDGASRPKTAESRPASAGSLPGVRSAPNRSPITAPSSLNGTRANSPSVRSQYPPNTELFEVSRFQDDRAADGTGSAVVLALDKTAKKLEGKLENGAPVTIDVTKIAKIVRSLNDPDYDPKGRTTIATIYSKDDQGEHKQTLVLKSRDTTGKGLEYGCIHARRLARVLLTINPTIESVNPS